MWGFDHRQSRPVTSELLDLAEQGVLTWEQLARDALGWMSEAEVQRFARSNDYLQEQEHEEDHADADA
jgi:hypothetical protein